MAQARLAHAIRFAEFRHTKRCQYVDLDTWDVLIDVKQHHLKARLVYGYAYVMRSQDVFGVANMPLLNSHANTLHQFSSEHDVSDYTTGI